jgi:uncharacterized membrane protein
MLFRIRLEIRRLLRRMWVRCALFCLLAIVAAVLSALLEPFIPERFAKDVGADAVDGLLGVVASSMLAVATFSLATMVSAYASAASTATPRAISLLIEDSSAQNALATFIGAFLFSVLGIVLLSTGLFDAGGRLVLLGATIFIIVVVVGVLIRWIEQLARLGQVHETVDRVEEAAIAALEADRASPRFGASPPIADPGGVEIAHDDVGYVQEIDAASLEEIAVATGGPIHLLVRPGAFVHPARPVLRFAEPPDANALEEAKAAIVVGPDRRFDQDPRFGVVALSEIASRALSPGINDPGTAIDVLNTLLRVLTAWDRAYDGSVGEPAHRHLHAPDLDADDMLTAAFAPIARDGAGFVEVQIRLQKVLGALAAARDPALAAAAVRAAASALRRAERELTDKDDRARLDAALVSVRADATSSS